MISTYKAALDHSDTVSPWFARVAAGYLEQGETVRALKLCLAGTHEYPRYMTGALILGKCYEAMGQRVEAVLEYRRILDVHPDSAMLHQLCTAVEHREEEEFAVFREKCKHTIRKTGNAVSFERYIAEPVPEEESGIDFLLKQLQAAKSGGRPSVPEESLADLKDAGEGSGKIVTATLAEIYVAQKEYGEAIAAYRALIEQRPGDAERYRERLAEIELLARSQGSDAAG
jgi:tetratricopeptide (TPR) repeat protein